MKVIHFVPTGTFYIYFKNNNLKNNTYDLIVNNIYLQAERSKYRRIRRIKQQQNE